jgi:choline dehydrogenase
VLSIFKRSPVAADTPDLFCMALLTDFRGYSPGYCKMFPQSLNHLTWVVLKAYARNRAGEVTLSSRDARDVPYINFHYFEQGAEEDLAAILDGIRFVRKLTSTLRERQLMTEISPGPDCTSTEQLETYVRQNAWGHHACGTCAIGPREQNGVLESNFKVHGTSGLRVVDASVFPRIPGVFIVSAVYTVAEKAADVIMGRG